MSRGEAILVVDRVEGNHVVLLRDEGAGARPAMEEIVDATQLPPVSEGDVLRVPARAPGELDWAAATVEPELRRARLRQANERLARLRRRDPGGDITL